MVFTERVPDGLQRAWRSLRRQPPASGAGRWSNRTAAFEARFLTAAGSLAGTVRNHLDLGPGDDPAAVAANLEEALFLVVDSTLATCPLAVSDLLPALLELAPRVGKLPDLALVPDADQLAPDLRLQLADLALEHLGDLPADDRRAWTERLLDILDADPAPLDEPHAEQRRCWLAASLADRDLDDPEAVLARWEVCDRPEQMQARRHWSRLRRLELLAGCDRRRPDVPAAHRARTLAVGLPRDGGDELAVRLAAALATLDYRAPVADPDQAWYSGAVADDGTVQVVCWWGACPRDVLRWRPTTSPDALLARLRASGGRVIWQGDTVPTALSDVGGTTPLGRPLAPFLEVLLEPLLPAAGWSDELGHGLALARSGPWRQDWRPDLGLALLTPPGQDGRLQAMQQAAGVGPRCRPALARGAPSRGHGRPGPAGRAGGAGPTRPCGGGVPAHGRCPRCAGQGSRRRELRGLDPALAVDPSGPPGELGR